MWPAALRALLVVIALGTMPAGAQRRTAPDVAPLLMRIGERVQAYYARAISVVCRETVTLRQLAPDLTADGSRARRLVYELRIGWEPPTSGSGPPEASVLRQILTIDGRKPRPKDEPGCMDPKSVSPEPLAMLLPEQQGDYTFRWAGAARINGRTTTMIDYRARAIGPAQVTWRDDCVSIELPGRSRGRIWADPASGDVFRLDEGVTGAFEFPVPSEYRRPGGSSTMMIERADTSIRYRPVTFRDPDETLLLPASVETLTIIRHAGAPRMRKSQVFSDYRRFVTEARILQ